MIKMILIHDGNDIYAIPKEMCKEHFKLSGEGLEYAHKMLAESESDVEGQSYGRGGTFEYTEINWKALEEKANFGKPDFSNYDFSKNKWR